jgi:membrane protein implicated in regulation of membrane protease activity
MKHITGSCHNQIPFWKNLVAGVVATIAHPIITVVLVILAVASCGVASVDVNLGKMWHSIRKWVLKWFLSVRFSDPIPLDLNSRDVSVQKPPSQGALVGKIGTAVTPLKLCGEVLVDGVRHDAVSAFEMILKGKHVRVTKDNGRQLTVVEEVKNCEIEQKD